MESTARDRLRLAVVEDQTFTREVTVERLNAHYGDAAVIEAFATAEELLAAPARFDAVVLDLGLRGGTLQGPDAVRAVARSFKVVVFSGLSSGEALESAEAAGADAYVSKETANLEALISAIEAVGRGEHFVDPELLQRIGAAARKQLTARQQEVLRLEALGFKLGMIALELDPPLTASGVRSHIERIVEIHPDCAKQADRVRLAIDLGLVTPWEISARPRAHDL